jgi:hypothetical protein
MTPLLWIFFGGGFAVGACAVLLGAYRRRPADPERTPSALMIAQVREQVRRELEAERKKDAAAPPPQRDK